MTKLTPMEELEFEYDEETFILPNAVGKMLKEEAAKQKISQAIEMIAMSCGDLDIDGLNEKLDEVESNLELVEDDD